MVKGPPASLLVGLLILSPLSTWAGELRVEGLTDPLSQGELRPILVKAPEPLAQITGRFLDLGLPFRSGDSGYVALLAADLEAPPGAHPFEIEAQGVSGARYRHQSRVQVATGRFGRQHLTLPKAMVDLDAETIARVRHEQDILAEIWQRVRGGPFWWETFRAPLDGELQVSSEFGLRRIINDQSRSPHSGVDFQAAHGTPVLASNGGLVAYAGEMFFSGKTVILHHGGGLFTLSFHLEGYRVEAGQAVARGEVIGWVGASGRVTGPHLHWGATLQGIRFDPRQLLHLTLP